MAELMEGVGRLEGCTRRDTYFPLAQREGPPLVTTPRIRCWVRGRGSDTALSRCAFERS